ncbi:MAG: hypothetical protein Q6373_015670 [Candidatus Sigynarchaeota archaeon]
MHEHDANHPGSVARTGIITHAFRAVYLAGPVVPARGLVWFLPLPVTVPCTIAMAGWGLMASFCGLAALVLAIIYLVRRIIVQRAVASK